MSSTTPPVAAPKAAASHPSTSSTRGPGSGSRPAPAHLDEMLEIMTARGASDLHIKPTRPPLLRINGRITPLDTDPLSPDHVEQMLEPILKPHQKKRLEERMSVDIGYGVRGLARFRGNLYVQRGNLAASFRRIPYEILGAESLNLPPVLLDFCDLPMGMVLLTGPTGSGKSTTLAALIKHITAERPVHVITIEDPMEFLFTDGLASISQREVGTDTTSFSEALRNAMRQDPDVIMVGEMRDPETIATAITAAETGHLVFSTLHTNSAAQSVDRIVDSFPAEQHIQIRAQLAQVLKGVVSMKLVEREDGSGRVAALEIMKASPKISRMIEKGEIAQLLEEIESSVPYHRMQSMNQSLMALLVHGTISYAEAMRQSLDPDDLSLKLRKMFPFIEEGQADPMKASTADFSYILELQDFKRLYEEQEEKVKLKLAEKDEVLADLRSAIDDRDEQMRQTQARIKLMTEEQEKIRADYNRLRQEAQEKIDKLMERIKTLNQQLLQK